ncbi:MAG: response regulator [Candidatus Kariarchaeaceae archaeon]|jgi:two-component system chemotaxis response regulator CheY
MASILIVDDSKFFAKILSDKLKLANHDTVATAFNFEQARQLYLQHRPDVVIMDIILPKQNGIVGIEKLMEMDENAKIIAFSSMNLNPISEQALLKGAIAFIPKNIKLENTFADLVETIEIATR